jgi:rod shape-determining protein MreB
MIPIGLDIGTNYTKATKDGKNVILFPSIVVYGEEKDWSLKGDEKDVYIGEEASAIIQNLENVEVLRPLHEGRLIHRSYLELARHALKRLDAKDSNLTIATGLPVKSSKQEREEVAKSIEENLKSKVLIFPEPVGTLAYMGIDTGVCIDIGYGTTDVVVLSYMEYLRGDTMLVGVDKLYENLEVTIRNKAGISITPEEMTKLLMIKDHEIGRIRSGKRVSISQKNILEDYNKLMKSWVDRISNRVKMILEGLSTSIVDRIVLTGGGSLLPEVFEEFLRNFEDVAKLTRPDEPITSNSKGYYNLAKVFIEENQPAKIEKAKKRGQEKVKRK